ncbi:hypothetical protein N6B72_21355 [Chryseobacterium soli]|uniref:Uncharacterized protein n=1 Tax=Chryseobacterium soli TaxID=445961 RepID=A0A086AD90_9FLAO|nr:hypothetical protein [Chryseobacterium soli]KFF14654.1 hypothetical protein IW15_04280 [Chryseobacterium soli]MDV7699466.1 hypothetical protein [Chryseobacterium soli]
MTNLVIILGMALSTCYTSLTPAPKANINPNTTTAPAEKLKATTYYVVNKRTGVPARNAAEADQIASVSAPYGNIAYLGSTACRAWWLNQPVVPGGVTWSYYYYAGSTISTTNNLLLILFCPL